MNFWALGRKKYQVPAPTLEEQIRSSKMSDQELISCLLPHGFEKFRFWLMEHAYIPYCFLGWNWFCIWCGEYHFNISSNKCNRRGRQ